MATDPTARVDRYDHGLAMELGQRICHALGVDPKYVHHVVFEWSPQQMPRAIVTMTMTEGVVREVLNLVPADRQVVDDGEG